MGKIAFTIIILILLIFIFQALNKSSVSSSDVKQNKMEFQISDPSNREEE
jgi:hypothetical protein